VKPKLLIVELWRMGDLVLATPFIRAAAEKYETTLLAKPLAEAMRPRLWPAVEVIPFDAPWTAFQFSSKYNLLRWPWQNMRRLRHELRAKKFDCAVSARWDPRDHFLLQTAGARERIGFPRLKSQYSLTQPLGQPEPFAHRSEYWRVAGRALGLDLPAREAIIPPPRKPSSSALIHSGARLPARVWPLENFHKLALRLRGNNVPVQVACDPDQLDWWRKREADVACPGNVGELFAQVDQAGIFIGNCSGPGHIAAICGVPTFTVYGPSLHEWWAPMHPAAEIFEGRACPYKPCSDYCRYKTPFCLWNVSADEVWPHVEKFAARHLAPISIPASA